MSFKVIIEPGKTYINKMEVITHERDETGVRLRLEQALARAGLHLPGLPETAVVCIRQLVSPLPLTSRPIAWERGVAVLLEEAARRAYYPAFQVVPPEAGAVIFAGPAEMLACLALDWCRNVAGSRWWWRSLFPEVALTFSPVPVWLETPPYIPAALHRLAGQKMAVPFVARLNDGEARQLRQSLTRSFALYELEAAIEEALPRLAQPALAEVMRQSEAQAGTGQARPAPENETGSVNFPWRRWVPESHATALSLEKQSLLGTGLALYRVPALARSPLFARAVQQSRFVPEVRPALTGKAPVRPGTLTPGARVSYSEDAGLPLPPDLQAGPKTVTPLEAPPPLAPVKSSLPARPAERQPGQIEDKEDGAKSTRQDEPSESRVAEAAPLTGTFPEELVEQNIEAVSFTTRLGGLFYLINLGLFLELYHDFTSPLRPGIALPIWDFVALAGQGLGANTYPADPLWGWLARLAGRGEGEAPGRSFEPPAEWRVPPGWLKPFPEKEGWRWSAEAGRLRLSHPAGFPVIDLALPVGDPLACLQAEIAVYPGLAGLEWEQGPVSGPAPDATGLARWLGWLFPYLKVRLQLALGLAEPGSLPGLLFEHTALINLTPAHLDIGLSLAALPLEIRLAGLDRDPGWVPAAGRYIAFHFD